MMNATSAIPKLERLSTLKFNENLDSANNYMPTNEEVNELVKFQKLKQLHNITKFEQLNNGANLVLINSLQDTELNDLMNAVNSYINLSIQKIHKKDTLFKVIIENFAYDPNESDVKTFSKSSKKNVSAPVVFEENINLKYLNTTVKNVLDKVSPIEPCVNDEIPITIDSILILDFLRNGLKCGPFQFQKEKEIVKNVFEQNSTNILPNLLNTKQEKESDIENASKNENTTPSASQLSFNKPMSSVMKPMSSVGYTTKPSSNSQIGNASAQLRALNSINNYKQLVTFKYMLVLDLNKSHFEIKQVNEKEMLYTIVMAEKPKNWSECDYEQLTLEVKSNNNESMEQIHSNILRQKEKYKGFKQFLGQEKKSRNLNSKAIFDRILKHFSTVLKTEWPDSSLNSEEIKKELLLKQMQANKHKAHQQYSTSIPQPKFQIIEESKYIEIKNNQLRIGFKWQGIKFKDLDVLLLINIGIKYHDELMQIKLNESLVKILNKFVTKHSYGYYQNIERNLQVDGLNKISIWLKKHLRIQFDQYHLTPNLVHYWSLNFRHLKLNFLKFLIFLNCLNPAYPTIPANAHIINPTLLSNINDLLNGVYVEKASVTPVKHGALQNSSQKAPIYNIFNNKKSPMFNFIAIMNNNCSFYLLLKILQIFFNTALNSIDITSKIDDDNQSEEDLIVDILLSEVQSTVDLHSWSIDNIFDRIWSCLFKIRESAVRSHFMDPLNICDNVLPSMILKYIGFYDIESIYFTLSPRKRTGLIDNKADRKKQSPLLLAIETMMKTIFTTVLTEEVNIYLLNYNNNDLEGKNKITNNNFNQLINQLKPGSSLNSDELSVNTFTGKATKGSEGIKSGFSKEIRKKNKLSPITK